jgi:hypothetical protein
MVRFFKKLKNVWNPKTSSILSKTITTKKSFPFVHIFFILNNFLVLNIKPVLMLSGGILFDILTNWSTEAYNILKIWLNGGHYILFATWASYTRKNIHF